MRRLVLILISLLAVTFAAAAQSFDDDLQSDSIVSSAVNEEKTVSSAPEKLVAPAPEKLSSSESVKPAASSPEKSVAIASENIKESDSDNALFPMSSLIAMRNADAALVSDQTAATQTSAKKSAHVKPSKKSLLKHETYITNDWFDNWYIGIAGGAITSFSKMTENRITPEFEANVLKWFTPEIGMRLGYAGQWGKEYITTSYNPYAINHSPLPFDGEYGGSGTLSYNMFYAHGDILWNLTNTFGGYKPNRTVNVSPYVNFGFLRMYDPENGANHDHEIGFGGGLYNTFKISERWVLTLDFRHINIASRYKTKEGLRTNFVSASAGIAYNIFRTYWNRTSTIVNEAAAAKAEATAAMATVKEKEAEVAAAHKEAKAQEQNVQELKKQISDMLQEPVPTVQFTGNIVYFEINSAKLSKTEKLHLADILKASLNPDGNQSFILTGSADKDTGSLNFNEKLSAARADSVKNILMKEYGIISDKIEITTKLVSGSEEEGPFARCVVIDIK